MKAFSALKFREFRLFWFGLLVSRIGSEMQVVVVSWQIYLLTNSALSLGLIGLARFLPIVLLSLAGAMAADLHNRRKIMIVSQFGFSKSFYLSLLFLAATSAADVVTTILRNTIRQLNTPDYIRGRMVSVNMIFLWADRSWVRLKQVSWRRQSLS